MDAIVCLDACFTQKRRKSEGKVPAPPHTHPETVFVPEEESAQMEEIVESVRPSKPRRKSTEANTASANVTMQAETDYEPGLRVPTTVLNECHDSFLAADSNRVKASTAFFADTGLMALLCRHDRVLWLVNMTSAGEKQHYALTLLDKLFQHIPQSMRIGVLYDIGCQLHRSCVKFDFLSHALDRITFGISVFHAYGHQWPCQLIYHPRKCPGFGLTDGEGCERFWSSIKLLIPSLRVSGYFHRIYTLDTQIKHLDEKSLFGLGKWLNRKWIIVFLRNQDAADILKSVYSEGFMEEIIRSEWIKQVNEQIKPLKKQTKNIADKEIQEILLLMKNIEIYKDQAAEYRMMIQTGKYENNYTLTEVQPLLQEIELTINKTNKSIQNKKAKLSVDEKENLTKLLGNNFLRARLNALALKERIRERLRQRKFELENLERAYRKTANHLKLDKHVEGKVKRKEPGIQQLAKKYNALCKDLKHMIQHGKAPKGAIVPIAINTDTLFQLDVDDDIWQDIGLTDENDNNVNIPLWLGNEFVRAGIKALLECDRCQEEKRRLISERESMQDWFEEEWKVLQATILSSEHEPEVVYELLQKESDLLHLCIAWQSQVKNITSTRGMEWGPSEIQLKTAKAYETEEQTLNSISEDAMDTDMELYDASDDQTDLDFDDEKGELDDAEFLDSIEATGRMESFRY